MELPNYLLGVPEDGAGPQAYKLEINGVVYWGWPANLFWRSAGVYSFDLLNARNQAVMRNICPQVDQVFELNQGIRE